MIPIVAAQADAVAASGRQGVFRRFARNKRGSTAVEFAFVAMPFFAIILAIIETAIVFFADQALETAVADASRLIMTGQAQQQGFDATALKSKVCSTIKVLFSCEADLKLDVRTYKSFAGSAVRPGDDEKEAYNPGSAGEIVVVRASYEWPIISSLVGLSLADRPNGKRLIAATAAFRNEPFE